MPTLTWIGKSAVENHHQEVPYHLLRDVPELGCGPADTGNLIVEGDNLTALKALLPYYAGQVKCIYIDPPYNTGNEGWVYNDNVSSPEIKAWLGKVVGKEAEDLSRHDKWLCMMYPRLKLLREFLCEDGVVFVSIDEIELYSLMGVLDEIFGRDRRVAVFTWVRKKKGSNLSKEFRKITEYVLAYKRSSAPLVLHGVRAYAEKLVPLLNRPNGVTRLNFPSGALKVGRGFPDGVVKAGIKGESKGELAVALENDVEVNGGIFVSPTVISGRWRWSQSTVEHELANGSEFFVSKDFRINVSRFNQAEKFKAPQSLLSPDDGIPTNEDATEELRLLFADKDKLPFDYPKPTGLISFLVQSATNPGDLILDSFAGSGTTGHAVLRLNSESMSVAGRRFILVQIPHETESQKDAEINLARAVTAERVKRVIDGVSGEPIGGGFRYVQLGDQLFDAAGKIRSSVRFRDLARHVFFTETGTPLPHDAPLDKPLLGVAHGTGIYLLYNGILKDKSVDGGNVLTPAILDALPTHDGPKVIYAASNRVSQARLDKLGFKFKQTPYAIKVR